MSQFLNGGRIAELSLSAGGTTVRFVCVRGVLLDTLRNTATYELEKNAIDGKGARSKVSEFFQVFEKDD